MSYEKKGTEFDCRYNSGVICYIALNCAKCGWCPAVSERRKEKIRAEREQMLAEGETC